LPRRCTLVSSPKPSEELSSESDGFEGKPSNRIGRKWVKLVVAILMASAAAKYAPQLLPAAIKDLAEISTSL